MSLLNSIDYTGPAGIEFKIDERDGQPKLIEVNARFGLWDNLCIYLDSDLFMAYYEDLTDQHPMLQHPQNKRVKWLSLSRDIPNFLLYIKEKQS
jgi:predicted ATP-grasp superfamily ATP-dependent carboligase